MATRRKRIGRPPNKQKPLVVSFSLTRDLRRRIEDGADANALSLSEFMRYHLDQTLPKRSTAPRQWSSQQRMA